MNTHNYLPSRDSVWMYVFRNHEPKWTFAHVVLIELNERWTASWWFGGKCLGISRWADDTRPDDDVKWLITACGVLSSLWVKEDAWVVVLNLWQLEHSLMCDDEQGSSPRDRRLVWPYDCCWVASPCPVPLFRTTLAAAATRRSDVWSSERFRRHYRHRTSSTSWTREDVPLCPPDRARGDNDIIRQLKQDPRRARRPEAAAPVEGCWVACAVRVDLEVISTCRCSRSCVARLGLKNLNDVRKIVIRNRITLISDNLVKIPFSERCESAICRQSATMKKP